MLRSKLILTGYFRGVHTVPFKGLSSEFSQYREYIPGDDFSRIDWKMFLRSRKAYIRESDDESNTDMFIMLDSTASMSFGGRFEYALSLAAVLGFISVRQNDSLGYAVFSGKGETVRPPSNRRGRMAEYFFDLSKAAPEGGSGISSENLKWLQNIKKRSFFIIISDGYFEESSLYSLLEYVKARKTDSLFFQIMSHTDKEIDLLSSPALRDMETSSLASGGSARERIRIIEGRNARIREKCSEFGIEHIPLIVEEGFEKPLSVFFERRSR